MGFIERTARAFNKLGFKGTVAYKTKSLYFQILEKLGFDVKGKCYSIHVVGYEYPVYVRAGTTDLHTFYQIFILNEYGSMADLKNPKTLLDCGANAGYASVYFLNKYPGLYSVAIEADPQNIDICKKNLADYEGRCAIVNSGIWSHKTGLIISRGAYRTGGEWSTQVRECKTPDEKPDLEATDIMTIIEQHKLNQIDILKVDIERAEIAVFSKKYEKWLNRVKNIVIELHDQECEEVFMNAINQYTCDELFRYGDEMTVCKNLRPKQVS